MCLTNKSKVIVAEWDIPIYKVCYSNGPTAILLFRNLDGRESGYNTKSELHYCFGIPAHGFPEFGYSSFESGELAKQYLCDVEKNVWTPSYLANKGLRITIHELLIPKESQYRVGNIRSDYVGAGLKAIQSQFIERRNEE